MMGRGRGDERGGEETRGYQKRGEERRGEGMMTGELMSPVLSESQGQQQPHHPQARDHFRLKASEDWNDLHTLCQHSSMLACVCERCAQMCVCVCVCGQGLQTIKMTHSV